MTAAARWFDALDRGETDVLVPCEFTDPEADEAEWWSNLPVGEPTRVPPSFGIACPPGTLSPDRRPQAESFTVVLRVPGDDWRRWPGAGTWSYPLGEPQLLTRDVLTTAPWTIQRQGVGEFTARVTGAYRMQLPRPDEPYAEIEHLIYRRYPHLDPNPLRKAGHA